MDSDILCPANLLRTLMGPLDSWMGGHRPIKKVGRDLHDGIMIFDRLIMGVTQRASISCSVKVDSAENSSKGAYHSTIQMHC